MTDTKYLPYDLAEMANEKGFDTKLTNTWSCVKYKGTEDESLYFSTLKPDKSNPDISDIKRVVNSTYHQLIDWVFDFKNLTCEASYLEFWYNHLKDCPLKGEFIYRLKERFRNNGIEIHITWIDTLDNLYGYQISSTGNAIRPDSDLIRGFNECEDSAIIEVFKLLKKIKL